MHVLFRSVVDPLGCRCSGQSPQRRYVISDLYSSATMSISIGELAGILFASMALLAGLWGKYCSYTWFNSAKSSKFAKYICDAVRFVARHRIGLVSQLTVTLTALLKDEPAAFSTTSAFWHILCVCSATVPCMRTPLLFAGICPDTNTNPLAFTA